MGDSLKIACTQCGAGYPQGQVVHCCPECGGVFDFTDPFPFDPQKVDAALPGLWRYRHSFGLPECVEPVSLGEGATPLVWAEVSGRKVAFKCEYLNPSGSFKDRGSSLIAAWLKSRGISEAVEDSSGNAGASFAAYAARAGIQARIFVPASASGPKRTQIEVHGAELVPILGSREDVTRATLKTVEAGAVYASHAWMPFNLPGYATAAYEIHEQIGQMPGTVITPVGQGGLLLGLARGFDALRIATNEKQVPQILGVEASAYPILWNMYQGKREIQLPQIDPPTLAEGVKVRHPVRAKAVLTAVRESQGSFVTIDEVDILPARDELARMGFYVEPTSALAWAAFTQAADLLSEPVVVILTGFGLKYGVK